MRRMPSLSQKIEARTFPADFAVGFFWGGVSRYAATPLIIALSPGHGVNLLRRLALQEKKNDSSRLDVVEMVRVA